MPTNARKRHRIGTGGPWGTGLLLLGVGITAQGGNYLFARPYEVQPALESLSHIVPLWACGIIWVAAGLSAIHRALTPPQKHSDIWPVVGVLVLWTGIYFFHWLIGAFVGDFTRSWASAVGWGCLVALVLCWGRCVNPPPEPPR